MLTLPIELTDEIENEVSFTCLLLDIEHTTPIRYVNIDQDIFYNGNVYYAFPFSINNIDLSLDNSVHNLSIDLDAVAVDLVAIILNNDLRGTNISVNFAALEDSLSVIGTIILFSGIITDIRITDTKISITAQDEMYRWMDREANKHTALCPWRFKDPNTCKYSGTETWCDKTYERCTALGNTVHFRGFRYLPELQEKDIWWGRTPK